MHDLFSDIYTKLVGKNLGFARATVVRTENPSSSKPGDKAIITLDGKVHGWIGGGCTKSIVIHEAKNSIKTNKAAFIRIAPDAEVGEYKGIKTYKMTCQSGGTVDVFIEPVLSKPHIIIFGNSAVAKALCQIGCDLNYRISVLVNEDDAELYPGATTICHDLKEIPFSNKRRDFLIICTQGENDRQHLKLALEADSGYIGFVSSRKKAHSLFRELRSEKVGFEDLEKIKTPAGLDIGAKSPEEIALSILAEVISIFRKEVKSQSEFQDNTEEKDGIPQVIVNPVCRLPIQRIDAKYTEEKNGKLMYFCCEGCKKIFDTDKEKYWALLEKSESA
jgi:xanthine dehydrogenase accessory factor